MPLIERVQAILLRPRQTWPVIAAEPADTASIYTQYLMVIAAIPVLARFIGYSLIGFGAFGVGMRVPIVTGLVVMVVGYVVSLLMVFVVSLIVNALAPTFGGSKDPVAALKLVAYASTAGMVGGIFNIIPVLGILALLAGLYSIYLLYAGIAVLMRCPPEKAGAYTAVVVVCAIVVGVVLFGVLSLLTPSSPFGMAGIASRTGGPGSVVVKTPDGAAVTINPSGMADLAKRMEDAGKRMEQAQKSGDNQAAGKAMGEMLGALAGGNATPIASADLKAMLPDSLGDMKRKSIEAQSGQAMGIGGSSATASYGAGERSVHLSITDTGGLAGLAAMAGWANMTMDKETDGKIEKVYKDGARTVHEEYRKDGSHGEVTVILANGVIVQAEGSRLGVDQLKGIVAGVDLGKLEAMKRSAEALSAPP